MRIRFETVDGVCYVDPECVAQVTTLGVSTHRTRIDIGSALTPTDSFVVMGTLAEVLEKLEEAQRATFECLEAPTSSVTIPTQIPMTYEALRKRDNFVALFAIRNGRVPGPGDHIEVTDEQLEKL